VRYDATIAEGRDPGHANVAAASRERMSEKIRQLIDKGEWRRAAELTVAAGAIDQAIELYEKLLDYEAVGDLLAGQGDLPAALEHCRRANAIEAVQRTQRQLSVSLSDQLHVAVDILAKHRRYHEAAELAAASGRPVEAAQLYRDARNYLAAAQLFERVGDLREAGSLYERHLEGASSTEAALGLGRILQRLERHIDACGALHQALAASHDADDE